MGAPNIGAAGMQMAADLIQTKRSIARNWQNADEPLLPIDEVIRCAGVWEPGAGRPH